MRTLKTEHWASSVVRAPGRFSSGSSRQRETPPRGALRCFLLDGLGRAVAPFQTSGDLGAALPLPLSELRPNIAAASKG
jgi:hypothetical protein